MQVFSDTGTAGTEAEVLVFSLPHEFSANDVLEKLRYALELSKVRRETLLAVINSHYRLLTIKQIYGLLDRFDFINRLSREEPQYRIFLVIEISEQNCNLLRSIKISPSCISEWLCEMAKETSGVLTRSEVSQILQHHPLGTNHWVSIGTKSEDGVIWCRNNAFWKK